MAASEPVVGPRVLVIVATKHGATREIAEAIVRDLAVSDDGRAMRLTALPPGGRGRPPGRPGSTPS